MNYNKLTRRLINYILHVKVHFIIKLKLFKNLFLFKRNLYNILIKNYVNKYRQKVILKFKKKTPILLFKLNEYKIKFERNRNIILNYINKLFKVIKYILEFIKKKIVKYLTSEIVIKDTDTYIKEVIFRRDSLVSSIAKDLDIEYALIAKRQNFYKIKLSIWDIPYDSLFFLFIQKLKNFRIQIVIWSIYHYIYFFFYKKIPYLYNSLKERIFGFYYFFIGEIPYLYSSLKERILDFCYFLIDEIPFVYDFLKKLIFYLYHFITKKIRIPTVYDILTEYIPFLYFFLKKRIPLLFYSLVEKIKGFIKNKTYKNIFNNYYYYSKLYYNIIKNIIYKICVYNYYIKLCYNFIRNIIYKIYKNGYFQYYSQYYNKAFHNFLNYYNPYWFFLRRYKEITTIYKHLYKHKKKLIEYIRVTFIYETRALDIDPKLVISILILQISFLFSFYKRRSFNTTIYDTTKMSQINKNIKNHAKDKKKIWDIEDDLPSRMFINKRKEKYLTKNEIPFLSLKSLELEKDKNQILQRPQRKLNRKIFQLSPGRSKKFIGYKFPEFNILKRNQSNRIIKEIPKKAFINPYPKEFLRHEIQNTKLGIKDVDYKLKNFKLTYSMHQNNEDFIDEYFAALAKNADLEGYTFKHDFPGLYEDPSLKLTKKESFSFFKMFKKKKEQKTEQKKDTKKENISNNKEDDVIGIKKTADGHLIIPSAYRKLITFLRHFTTKIVSRFGDDEWELFNIARGNFTYNKIYKGPVFKLNKNRDVIFQNKMNNSLNLRKMLTPNYSRRIKRVNRILSHHIYTNKYSSDTEERNILSRRVKRGKPGFMDSEGNFYFQLDVRHKIKKMLEFHLREDVNIHAIDLHRVYKHGSSERVDDSTNLYLEPYRLGWSVGEAPYSRDSSHNIDIRTLPGEVKNTKAHFNWLYKKYRRFIDVPNFNPTKPKETLKYDMTSALIFLPEPGMGENMIFTNNVIKAILTFKKKQYESDIETYKRNKIRTQLKETLDSSSYLKNENNKVISLKDFLMCNLLPIDDDRGKKKYYHSFYYEKKKNKKPLKLVARILLTPFIVIIIIIKKFNFSKFPSFLIKNILAVNWKFFRFLERYTEFLGPINAYFDILEFSIFSNRYVYNHYDTSYLLLKETSTFLSTIWFLIYLSAMNFAIVYILYKYIIYMVRWLFKILFNSMIDAVELKGGFGEGEMIQYFTLEVAGFNFDNSKNERTLWEYIQEWIDTWFKKSQFNPYKIHYEKDIRKKVFLSNVIGSEDYLHYFDHVFKLLGDNQILYRPRSEAFKMLLEKESKIHMMLAGSSGTGKTHFVKALGGELDVPVLIYSPNDYTGSRETQLVKLFAKARQMAPCIVFIDEIDSLAQKRKNLTNIEPTEWMAREKMFENIVSPEKRKRIKPVSKNPSLFRDLPNEEGLSYAQSVGRQVYDSYKEYLDERHENRRTLFRLLLETDAITRQNKLENKKLYNRKNIILMGATNRVDLIDHALLRPGRFATTVYFTLPSRDRRRQVFLNHANPFVIDPNFKWDYFLDLTKGWSNAQIALLLKTSSMKALTWQKKTQSYIDIKHNNKTVSSSINSVLGISFVNLNLNKKKKKYASHLERRLYMEASRFFLEFIFDYLDNKEIFSLEERKDELEDKIQKKKITDICMNGNFTKRDFEHFLICLFGAKIGEFYYLLNIKKEISPFITLGSKINDKFGLIFIMIMQKFWNFYSSKLINQKGASNSLQDFELQKGRSDFFVENLYYTRIQSLYSQALYKRELEYEWILDIFFSILINRTEKSSEWHLFFHTAYKQPMKYYNKKIKIRLEFFIKEHVIRWSNTQNFVHKDIGQNEEEQEAYELTLNALTIGVDLLKKNSIIIEFFVDLLRRHKYIRAVDAVQYLKQYLKDNNLSINV